ncbi:MAG: hypothetical protein EZS28_036590, partial [Streblomastix strix]
NIQLSSGNELADVALSKLCYHGQLNERKTKQCTIKFGIIYPRRLLHHHSTVATNLQTSLGKLASSLHRQANYIMSKKSLTLSQTIYFLALNIFVTEIGEWFHCPIRNLTKMLLQLIGPRQWRFSKVE